MVSLKSAKTVAIDLTGQGFTTGFDVMNSNLVLTAEQKWQQEISCKSPCLPLAFTRVEDGAVAQVWACSM